MAVSVPSAPRSPVAVAGSAAIRVSWSAPSSTGGAMIDKYAVRRSTSAAGPWTAIAYPTSLSITNSPVRNGTRYYYVVLAHNRAGWSRPSSVVSAVAGTPSAPRSVAATPGSTTMTLTWAVPWSSGGAAIDRYAVQQSRDGRSWATISNPTGLRVHVGGLTNGVRYFFRVVAHNRYGFGSWSSVVSAIPRTKPSAPRSPVARPGNTQITVTWAAPSSTGGAAVDKYAVQRSTSSTGPWVNVGFPTSLTFTSSGLVNGTRYYLRILAHNAAGWGPVSPAVSAIPRTVPSAPRNLATTLAVGQITLSWQAPSSNGGAAIDSYAVQRWDASTWVTTVTVTGLTHTHTGLANGTTYQYRVLAHNAAGWGASSPVATVTTPAVPGAPTGASATPGDRFVTLQWNPPASDGGSAIIGYDIWNYQTGATARVPAGATGYTASGLQNGTSYFFTIRAVNAVGVSSQYAAAQATPASVPGIPLCRATQWDLSDYQAYLSFTAPGSDGGSPITGYHLELWRFRDNVWSVIYEWTGTPGTSGGSFIWVSPAYLQTGYWYSIHVSAVNAMGTGPTCNGDNVWGALHP